MKPKLNLLKIIWYSSNTLLLQTYIYLDFRDLWVGLFWDTGTGKSFDYGRVKTLDLYICIIPIVVFRWHVLRKEYDMSEEGT